MKMRLKRPVYIVLITILILLISLLIFLTLTTKKNDPKKDFEQLVVTYFDTNIRSKVLGINRHKVTLNDIKRSGISVNDFEINNNNCDLDKAHVYVVVENPKEEKYDLIKYKLETVLDCK